MQNTDIWGGAINSEETILAQPLDIVLSNKEKKFS